MNKNKLLLDYISNIITHKNSTQMSLTLHRRQMLFEGRLDFLINVDIKFSEHDAFLE